MKKVKLIMIALIIILVSCKKEEVKCKDIRTIQLDCPIDIIALADYTDENGIKHINTTIDKNIIFVDWSKSCVIKSTIISKNKFILYDLSSYNNQVIIDSFETNNYQYSNNK